MWPKIFAALEKAAAKEPATAEVVHKTRTLMPTAPNEDGTYSYMFVGDPFVEHGTYDLQAHLSKVLPDNEVEALLQVFESCQARPQQILTMTQSELGG